jgi:alpha-2-macroglobulin
MFKRFVSFLLLLLFVSCQHISTDTATKDYLKTYADQKGPLKVDYHIPQGKVTINTNKIVMHFNQPMVGLTRVGQQDHKNLVSIKPHIPGYFKWANTRTLVYQAKGNLPFATAFTVTIHAGKESLLGFALLKDINFTFQTPRPLVKLVTPPSSTKGISRSAEMRIIFNQPVVAKTVYGKIHLTEARKSEDHAIKIDCYWEKELQKKGQEKGCTEVVVFSEKPLPKNTSIVLRLAKGIKSIHGNLLSEEDRIFNYETHGDFVLNDVVCEENCDPEATLAFLASTPITKDDLYKYILFHPEVPGFKNAYKSWSRDRKALSVYLDLKPFQQYTVTVSPDLKDIHGQKLGKEHSFKFKTAHYKPEIHVPDVSDQVLGYSDSVNLGFLATNVSEATAHYKIFNANKDIIQFLEASAELPLVVSLATIKWDVVTKLTGGTTDKRKLFSVSLPDVLKDKTSGIVLSDFTSPDVKYYDDSDETYIIDHHWLMRQITDLGIDFKQSEQDGLIWVTNLQTAKSVPQANVTIYNSQAQILHQAKTNNKGFVKLPGRMALIKKSDALQKKITDKEHFPFYIFVSKGLDRSFMTTEWVDDIDYYGSNYYNEYAYSNVTFEDKQESLKEVRGHILTDRGLYKPGEKVNIKGYLREMSAKGFMPFTKPVVVFIHEPRKDKPTKLTVIPNERGNISFVYDLSEIASLGYYSISFETKDDHAKISAHGKFDVQKFRTPEFKVQIIPQKDTAIKGDPIKLAVQANYLFGAPMREAVYKGYFSYALSSFSPLDDGLWQFGRLYDHKRLEQDRYYRSYHDVNGQLSKEGSVLLTEKTDQKALDPVRFNYEIEVLDRSKQSQVSSQSLLIHPASYYIAAKLDKLFYKTNDALTVHFMPVSPLGKTVLDRRVHAELVRVKWVSVKKEALHSQYRSETKRVEDVVTQCVRDHTQKDNSCSFEPTQSGYYYIRLTSLDQNNRKAITEIPFYVTGESYSYWPSDDEFALEIVKDKKEYQVGDVAKVLIKSPFQRAQALISIERDRILSYKTVTLEGSSPIIDVPIEEGMAPNVFLRLVLIKGIKETDSSFTSEDISKAEIVTSSLMRTGFTELKVKAYNKDLVVVTKTGKNVYKPGDDVQLDFRVKGLAEKQTAEITVMVVDEGVLLAGGYKLKNPLETLYKPFYLDVVQMDSRSRFVGSQGFDDKLSDPASGGGRMKGFRKKFIPLVYFNGEVVTDENGVAFVNFTLPDQLTNFVVMAIANANVDQFGLGQTSFQTKKDLMIRPALPRFLRDGDQVVTDIVIHNNLDKPQDVALHIDSKELRILRGKKGKVSIPAKSSVTYSVSFDVAKPKKIEWTSREAQVAIVARSDDASDRVLITLPLYRERPLETVSSSGIVVDAASEFFEKTSDMVDDYGSLTISLNASLLSRLKERITILRKYPYDCLEQRLSKLYPIVLFPADDAYFSGNDKDPDRRFEKVKTFIEQLKTAQHYQGGFGFWPGGKENPQLTLAVAEFLIMAQHTGHDVTIILDKINKRIRDVYLNRKAYFMNSYDEAYRTKLTVHSLFVLYKQGTPRDSYYASLQVKLFNMDFISQLKLVEMVLAKTPDSSLGKEWLQYIENKIRVKGAEAYVDSLTDTSGYYYGYSSKSLSALVLQGVLAVDPMHPMVFPLLRGLLKERRTRHYVSTVESLQVLKGLKAYQHYFPHSKEDVFARIDMNEKELLMVKLTKQEAEKKIPLPLDKGLPRNMKVTMNMVAGKMFFYDMQLDYALKDYRPYGVEQGITMTRQYYDLEGQSVMPDKIEQGKTYKVALGFYFADPIDYLVVEEPLAAGMEPINFNLSNVRQSLNRFDTSQRTRFKWYLSHREFHDKKILLFADHIPRGFYEFVYFVNATNQGEFLLPPAKAFEMYEPAVFGTTGAMKISIK